MVVLGGDLPAQTKEQLLQCLRRNVDIFAWSSEDIPGISKEIIEHHLNIDPWATPLKQHLRKASAKRQEVIKEEVAKLLKAGIIGEIDYITWLANPVLVMKKTGQWRMCIDFTRINRACPKDDFPLPRIDQLVDSTAGCELLSFLDAYSGYHQVQMARQDEVHASFVTHGGTYCYLRMTFGLKNAGTTFARLVQKSLGSQYGRNVEAYVDDIVVKSKKEEDH